MLQPSVTKLQAGATIVYDQINGDSDNINVGMVNTDGDERLDDYCTDNIKSCMSENSVWQNWW